MDEKLSLASGRCYANFGFFIGATRHNLEDLKRATRTAGIKIFVGSSTGDLLVDDSATLERIFAQTSLPIATHCEDEAMVQANAARLRDRTAPETHSQVRTPEAAAASVRRIGELAVRHRHRLHILHLSSRAELEVLAEDDCVSGEICVPHLFLDTSDYAELENFAKVNPALRSRADRLAMWEALRAGRFANLATDHAPHTRAEKAQPYPLAPSGIPSIEKQPGAHARRQPSRLDRAFTNRPAHVLRTRRRLGPAGQGSYRRGL